MTTARINEVLDQIGKGAVDENEWIGGKGTLQGALEGLRAFDVSTELAKDLSRDRASARKGFFSKLDTVVRRAEKYFGLKVFYPYLRQKLEILMAKSGEKDNVSEAHRGRAKELLQALSQEK